MSLRLYDSHTRSARDFVPVLPGQVSVYVCGATPQSGPHIGHLRAAVSFDVLRRWLLRSGYDVTYIRNVTDIDDKILLKSAEANRPWWAHAYHYEQEFTAAYDALNVLRPTYEPHATGHMTEMVELIQRLVDAGHAYAAEDGSGVYFDVRSWPDYGELTRQRVDEIEAATDAETTAKRDPRDFALWKASKAHEPATAAWPSPWGRGRPGWHIECSAMATKYLGAQFDIHGGGLDLRFPHHENEIAQSRAAGDPFANFWLHNAWVVESGEKMSKSLGNVLSIEALSAQVPAVVIRYLLAVPHYRSNIEVQIPESLVEARTAYERIENFLTRVAGDVGAELTDANPAQIVLPLGFVAAMNDDLGTPAAMAVVFETVKAGNSALADGDPHRALEAALQVRAMTDVLGIDPLNSFWRNASTAESEAGTALQALVSEQLARRASARANHDYATADGIRDFLTSAGILVEDGPDGARWTIRSETNSKAEL